MKELFKLEFNEEQQAFCLSKGNNPGGPGEWVTLFNKCSLNEFKLYEAYVTREERGLITLDYLAKSLKELTAFAGRLKELNLCITDLDAKIIAEKEVLFRN